MKRSKLLYISLIITLGLSGCKNSQKAVILHSLSRPSYSEDMKCILISAYTDLNKSRRNILLVDTENKEIRRISNEKNDVDPVFSNDGSSIIYINFNKIKNGSRIIKFDIENRRGEILNNDKYFKINPSLSHDDNMLIYAKATLIRTDHFGGKRWNDMDIYTYSFVNKNEDRLTYNKYYSAYNPYFMNNMFVYTAFDKNQKLVFSSLAKLSEVEIIRDEIYNLMVSKNHIIYTKSDKLYVTDIETRENLYVYDQINAFKSPFVSSNGEKLLVLSISRSENLTKLLEIDLNNRITHEISFHDYKLCW